MYNSSLKDGKGRFNTLTLKIGIAAYPPAIHRVCDIPFTIHMRINKIMNCNARTSWLLKM